MKNLKSDKGTVCIAGKNDVACESLLFLANNCYVPRDNILALPNSSDQDVEWMKSLRKTALQLGTTIVDAIEELYEIGNLVFFSLEYDKIINPEKFRSNQLFNIHFSKLPAYKGMYTSAWPILNAEKTTGVTLHKIDKRIDGGDILDQLEFDIFSTDTCRDLYFRYNLYAIELFKKNVGSILKGDYKTHKQSPYGSSYYSKSSIDYKVLNIDLRKTAFEVHNQIRAFVFPEYQLPEIYGYKITKSEIMNEPSVLMPGQIVSDNKELIDVATIDYNIRLHKEN